MKQNLFLRSSISSSEALRSFLVILPSSVREKKTAKVQIKLTRSKNATELAGSLKQYFFNL
jgi:hypothetical protein